MSLDVVLGDWGVARWQQDSESLTGLITPIATRSPEVVLEAPWTSKTDIWSLGATNFEIMGICPIFEGHGDSHGTYNELQHLYEMNLLFGPFPLTLLNIAKDQWRVLGMIDVDGNVWGPPRRKCLNPEMFWQLIRGKFGE